MDFPPASFPEFSHTGYSTVFTDHQILFPLMWHMTAKEIHEHKKIRLFSPFKKIYYSLFDGGSRISQRRAQTPD